MNFVRVNVYVLKQDERGGRVNQDQCMYMVAKSSHPVKIFQL